GGAARAGAPSPRGAGNHEGRRRPRAGRGASRGMGARAGAGRRRLCLRPRGDPRGSALRLEGLYEGGGPGADRGTEASSRARREKTVAYREYGHPGGPLEARGRDLGRNRAASNGVRERIESPGEGVTRWTC